MTKTVPGRFITFEGIDGSGKTTHIEKLADWLRARDYEVVLLREPGGTEIGEKIRAILLDRQHLAMTAITELLLFEAARNQLVEEVIRPALARGVFVISDRFMDSSVAYQGYGRGLGPDIVHDLNGLAIGDCRPDLTIWLDAPASVLKSRIARRGDADRLDLEEQSFRERTLEGFRRLSMAEPARIVRVSTEKDKETTFARIVEQVRRILL